MKIYLGADHAGFELKEYIKKFLLDKGYQVSDEGAYKYNEADDYPDYMKVVALQVACEPESRGIIFGGSGEGEAISANRFKGIRAVVYYGKELEIVKLSREHNDANVLSIGARFVTQVEAEEAISLWLATAFSNDERHIRRLKKLDGEETAENVF